MRYNPSRRTTTTTATTLNCFSGNTHVFLRSEIQWAIAHELYGPGTPAGQCWAKGLLHSLRHGQEKEFVRTLEQLLQPKPQASSSPSEISTPPVLQEDPDLLKLPENTSDPISKDRKSVV